MRDGFMRSPFRGLGEKSGKQTTLLAWVGSLEHIPIGATNRCLKRRHQQADQKTMSCLSGARDETHARDDEGSGESQSIGRDTRCAAMQMR